ncbi:WAT1-related protein At3g30340 [Carica papaya]|uniref:WAT1-related protein At3g30340 n=1 Tax=Carica papaya TaxID=3649 RepID=UPI000B8D1A54|nr:WAT1-related protein At3g30340 [Carica papaya]
MKCNGGEFWRCMFVMILVNLALAAMNILLKVVLDAGIQHMVIVTYRLIIATVFLTPIAYFLQRTSRHKLTAIILCQLFFSALVGTTLTQYFFLLGLDYTSATFACAFINLVPAMTFLSALPFKLEKVDIRNKSGRAKVLGTLICICGALVLILYRGMPLTTGYHNLQENFDNSISHSKKKVKDRSALGSILLIIGCSLWGFWFIIQARIGKKYPCQYSSTAVLSFFGAIQSGILSLSQDRSISMWVLKGKFQILTVIYAGAVGSGLSYVGLSWCVKKKGPVFTSAFTPLIQIFAAILDFSFLHEQIYFGSVLGSMVVIIGLYMVLWGKSKDAEECVKKQTRVIEEEDCNCVISQVISVNVNSAAMDD